MMDFHSTTSQPDRSPEGESAAVSMGTLDQVARFFGLRVGATDPARAARHHHQQDLLRLRAAVDASSDAIFVVDLQCMRFVDVNDGAMRMLGYSWSEFLEMAPWDISPLPRATIEASYAAMIAEGRKNEEIESELVRKDGVSVPVHVSRCPLQSEGRWYIIGVVRDVSEAKRADRAVAQSRGLYQTLFDLNPLPMWVYDLETLAFLAVNQAAIKQYGYARDEFLAMTIRDIRPAEDLPRLQANLEQAS